MPSPAPALALSASQKAELEGLVRSGSTTQKVALRCRLLLLAHQGIANQSIAEQLGVSRPTIVALRGAFAKDGLAAVTGIRRRHRRGSVLTPELEQKIVDTTVKTRPGDGSTHWSVRMLARKMGVSRSIVHRVWQRHDVQPHRVEKFKLSSDPRFEEKVRDVVGLYLNPPERALVLCVDEKSQIQALDRTQPLLPLQPGQVERGTHDYKRNGTTSLFAALDLKTSRVIGQLRHRHRSVEFRRFLDLIENQVPAGLDVHIIVDNYSTHKTAIIRKWFAKRPRFHVHFTPTYGSWINLVERWFAELTNKRIRRGVFRSVKELESAIREYIHIHNEDPTPFVWTKTADQILASIARYAQRTTAAHPA